MRPSSGLRGQALVLCVALLLLLLLLAGAAVGIDEQDYDDPDVDLNTPQTIRRHGYPAESHVVQTADGYLLTIHRIPGPRYSNATDAPAAAATASSASPAPAGTSPASGGTTPMAATAARTSPQDVAARRPSTTANTPFAWTTAWATAAGISSQSWTTERAAINGTTRSWTATDTAGSEYTRPWTTRETPVTNGTAPPPMTTTVESTSDGTRPWMTTEKAATNGTTPPWGTSAWTTPAGTTASSAPTSTLPANTTTPFPPTTTATYFNTTYFILTNSTPTSNTMTPTPETTTLTPPPCNTTLSTNAMTTTSTTTTSTTTTSTTTTSTTTTSTTTTSTTTTPTTTPTPTTPPPPQHRPVIFLQHGLLGSSFDWIVAGPGKALAYLLADAGYDVWMGNARGNTYSRAHVYLPTESSSPFWDFSFHEMGIYDLPAVIDYILNITGSPQLHYVGHSMGTTMFFVMASTKPEVAAGVASMYALAPVVFVKHIKSPIRLLAPFAHDVEFLARLLGEGEFLPQNKILHYLAKYGCELLETEKDVCENLIFILCGYDKPQFDTNILPVLLSHTPAGASTRTLIHYAQMIKSGKFQQYDLGKYGNLKKYRSLAPPSYDLTIVNVSIHLIYANNDWLAATVDVNALYQALHSTKTKYLVPLSSFNHLDFILAKDVKTLLYDKILKELPREFDYQNYEDNFLYD